MARRLSVLKCRWVLSKKSNCVMTTISLQSQASICTYDNGELHIRSRLVLMLPYIQETHHDTRYGEQCGRNPNNSRGTVDSRNRKERHGCTHEYSRLSRCNAMVDQQANTSGSNAYHQVRVCPVSDVLVDKSLPAFRDGVSPADAYHKEFVDMSEIGIRCAKTND